jgi:hypothetical protein
MAQSENVANRRLGGRIWRFATILRFWPFCVSGKGFGIKGLGVSGFGIFANLGFSQRRRRFATMRFWLHVVVETGVDGGEMLHLGVRVGI